MKAKSLIIVTLLVVLALVSLTIVGGLAAAQGPQPPLLPEQTGTQQTLLPVGPAAADDASRFGEAERVTTQQQAWNMELVGQIGGATYAVAVQGDYAYIGMGPHLVILNISDPAHPAVVGQTGVLPGVVHSVAVSGSYAYVAAGEAGLRIVDVSDPAHPSETGFYDSRGLPGA